MALGCANGDILMVDLESAFEAETMIGAVDRAAPLSSELIYVGHKNKVTSLVWTDYALMSASEDHTVRVWRNQEDVTIFKHDDCAGKIELSADGRQLISGGGGYSTNICSWDITEQKDRLFSPDQFGHVACLASRVGEGLVPETRLDHVAAGFMNGTVLLWKVYALKRPIEMSVIAILEHTRSPVSQLAWSNDGRYLASMGQDQTILIKDVFDLAKPQGIIRANDTVKLNAINWLTVGEQQTCLAVAASDGVISIYDSRALLSNTGEKSVELFPHDKIVKALESSPSNSSSSLAKTEEGVQFFTVAPRVFDRARTWLIAAKAQVMYVSILQQATHQLFNQFLHPNGSAKSVSWSPSGDYFVTVDKTQTIYVWDAAKYLCLFFYESKASMKCLSWHDEWLVLGTYEHILIWHMPAENPNWQGLPKEIQMGASFLNVQGDNLVISKDKGIFLLSFTQLMGKTSATNPWVGSIKSALLLDRCSFLDAVDLSETVSNYVALKRAIPPVTEAPGFFSRLFGVTQPKQVIHTLPAASSQADLLQRFGAFPSNGRKLEEDRYELGKRVASI